MFLNLDQSFEFGSVKILLMLKQKIVLVTGASRGIGRAISKKFADEGAIVYAGVRNITNELEYVSNSGGKIIPIILDVCDKDSIKNCIVKIKHDFGKIDILVNNAGVTIIEKFEMMRSESLHNIYDVNVFGLINVTQTAIRLLKKSGNASIINMSSIMYDDSDIGQTAYASSKGAVTSMTKTWAKEFVANGIRVNAIAPGTVNTDMFNIIDDEHIKEYTDKIGLGRLAEPDEIANVALFLASDMSSYVTGEIINVNGGLVL